MARRLGWSPRGAGTRAQRGWLSLELSAVLVLSALMAADTIRTRGIETQQQMATIDAQVLMQYRKALQDYTDAFYQQLQLGLPVTRGPVTLVPGVAPGQSMNPQIADLIALNLLSAGFSGQLRSVEGLSLTHRIELTPVACVGLACNVNGLVYTNGPILRPGSGDVHGLAIGQMLMEGGAITGTSLQGLGATLVGVGDSWTEPNPVAGAPEGVVAARFGFNSSVLLDYVKMNDLRDPSLQGNLTVAGNGAFGGTFTATGAAALNSTLTVAGASTFNAPVTVNSTVQASGEVSSLAAVGSRDGVAACLRAALLATGEVLARAADCVTRVRLDPATGSVQANNAAGLTRVSMEGDTGVLSVRDGAGVPVGSLNGDTGRVSARMASLTEMGVSGAACAGPAFNEGDIVQDSAASGTVLVCRGGIWKRPGLEEGVAGGACPTTGLLGQTPAGAGLICRAGLWRLLNDRVSQSVAVALWSGNGAGVVAAPVCGAGGTPDIALAAVHGGSDYGGAPPRNRFEVRVVGAGPWSINPVMVDSVGTAWTTSFSGVSYDLGWTATTYCIYPA